VNVKKDYFDGKGVNLFDLFRLEPNSENYISCFLSEHIYDIITLTYQYLNMLKKEGPQEWIFKEFAVSTFLSLNCKIIKSYWMIRNKVNYAHYS